MSALGVTIAVSFGVEVCESFQIVLNGPLYCEFVESTLNW